MKENEPDRLCAQATSPVVAKVPQLSIRFGPHVGESLSSWRQRAGRENGFHLYPIPKSGLRRIDPDLGLVQVELGWLAAIHGVDIGEVHRASLRSFIGTLMPDDLLRHHPAWLLQSKNSQAEAANGPAYCVGCLRADKTPFFRLDWRVALYTECPIHAVALRDSCPHCGAGVWPHGANQSRLFTHGSEALNRCLKCRGLLTDVWPETVDPENAVRFRAILQSRVLALSPELEVPAGEAFLALNSLCQLFIRTRPNSMIARSPSPQWSDLARAVSSSCAGVRSPGALPIPLRRDLIRAVLPLLEAWPERLLSFADATALTQQHFSGAEHLHPPWMQEQIYRHLRRQNRGISVERVHEVISRLTANSEQVVTKAAVRSALRSQSAVIDQVLMRRKSASRSELAQTLRGMRRAANGANQTRAVALCKDRDQAIFCVAVLGRRSIQEVSLLRPFEIARMVPNLLSSAHGAQRAVAALLRTAWTRYQSRVGSAGGSPSGWYVLKPGSPTRCATRRMRTAMTSLDHHLMRCPSVFWLETKGSPMCQMHREGAC